MKKIGSILTLAVIVLTIGICVAYYNTSSFGYDNANIISFDNESVKLFDYNIKYKDVKEKIDKIENSVPDVFVTI